MSSIKIIDDFYKVLLNIIENNSTLSFSLKELSKLQMIKNLMDNFQFLNMIYQENYKKRYFDYFYY